MNRPSKPVTTAVLRAKWRKKLGLTLTQFKEFVDDMLLTEMRRGHEEGHAIAALDALCFCKERNLTIPDWAAKAIVTRDHLAKRRKGQKPPELQYRKYLKDSIRYLSVRVCEDKRFRDKEKRLDKFGEALEGLDGHWAATKEVTGLNKSFYDYKKKWTKFYLSYTFYRLAPKPVTFLCSQLNPFQLVLLDWLKK